MSLNINATGNKMKLSPYAWISYLTDKASVFGTVVAAMGCASCFPAMGSLASALGMGVLAQYEGVFINTLLPIFASIALISNVLSYLSHRVWYRTVIGITGPVLILLTLYPWWSYSWSTPVFYFAIALMLFSSVFDMISPAKRSCHIKEQREEGV